MDSRSEFLEICEKSLRKYLTMDSDDFEADRSVLMLECHMICHRNLDNEIFGDVICYKCAALCIDCLDPTLSIRSEEVTGKLAEIHRYLKGTELKLRTSAAR